MKTPRKVERPINSQRALFSRDRNTEKQRQKSWRSTTPEGVSLRRSFGERRYSKKSAPRA